MNTPHMLCLPNPGRETETHLFLLLNNKTNIKKHPKRYIAPKQGDPFPSHHEHLRGRHGPWRPISVTSAEVTVGARAGRGLTGPRLPGRAEGLHWGLRGAMRAGQKMIMSTPDE